MISTDPRFSGATWRPYAEELWWSFAEGSGSRTLYAKLRDAAKQEVQSSDTVTVQPVEYEYKVFLPLAKR